MSLRSTAASSSRIRKSGLSKKSPLSPLKPKPKQPKRAAPKSNDDDHSKLTILDHNVHLQYELSGQSSMLDAIDQLVFNQWSEQNMYHDRHYSQEAKQNASNSPSDLLFSLRGLSMEVKAEILKYRSHQLPSGILTVNQLYTMFDHMGNTFVDRSLEMCIRKGLIKKFVITNASPVISRNGQIGFNPKVTYGYENTDVVVKTEQYLSLIEESKDGDDGTLTKFRTYVENNPESLFVTNEDFSAPQLSLLVNLGFLTLTSNHHNEIDVHQYSISFPKCGTFLKIINAGRTWLVKTLGKSKYDELLEDVLFEKWEGKNLANFRKPFYGYDLLWVLADARGAGVVEAFNTPVGRGWRLTGKL